MNFSNITEQRILAFGDSNTYGYDPARNGRYDEDERWPRRMERCLGPGWRVVEEGLPGRTAVFDDPITEGLCGLSAITPCMVSHAPLDALVLMLGTNDTKERFGCNAALIAQGILRLAKKAEATDAWRGKPEIWVVCPAQIQPYYRERSFHSAMGDGCAEKSAALAGELRAAIMGSGFHFMNAGRIAGVEVHPLDGIHLTREANVVLARELARQIGG